MVDVTTHRVEQKLCRELNFSTIAQFELKIDREITKLKKVKQREHKWFINQDTCEHSRLGLSIINAVSKINFFVHFFF